MPRRLAKRPVRALPTARIEIEDAQWRSIEQGYGCSLADVVRLEIAQVTNDFIALAVAEGHAPSTKEVRKRIEHIRRTARAFLSTLENTYDDAGLLAQDRIEQKFGDLRELHGSIAVLAVNCDQALTDLESATRHYRGSVWEHWVRELTSIAKKHNLPTGVRKDADKSAEDTPSQFVLLVQTLQKVVPENYRRHFNSSNALATAINLARRGSRVK